MNATTKRLRAAVRHIPGAWVRNYGGGKAWCGVRGEFVPWSVGGEPMLRAKAALEAAGFRCALNGRPGSSGENTIDVDYGEPQ